VTVDNIPYRTLCTDCGISRTSNPKRCGDACQFIKPNYPHLETQVHGRIRDLNRPDELHFGPFIQMHRASLKNPSTGAQWTGITTRIGERLLETHSVDAILAMTQDPNDSWKPLPILIDRALNIMPLFHIHGLIAGVLAPLSAGSYVSCTPGFNALKFFSWMDHIKPTWFTAVPTMHQTILTRSSKNLSIIQNNPLRFIRSSSSSMPTKVIEEIEQCFGAPLIESYGMTEASHQMASNLLPPAKRKPGTVGVAAGPEIAIMDEAGKILGIGETGEIVIRGANVTHGYENNIKANTENFTNGWFRTGDQGTIDEDGYVTITGRLKEIINRGGEKISPREVDEILMEHPAVLQVVTFAIPHEKLGEEVAAVVVLREGKTAEENDIRTFAAEKLADFKVPKKIIFTNEIPQGATGKLQRISLAEKLGL